MLMFLNRFLPQGTSINLSSYEDDADDEEYFYHKKIEMQSTDVERKRSLAPECFLLLLSFSSETTANDQPSTKFGGTLRHA